MLKIYQKEGFQGFLKGGFTIMLRDFPFGGIMYSSYVIINKFVNHLTENNIKYFFSAILAAMIASAATHPFEIIRTKIQANEMKKGVNKLLQNPGTEVSGSVISNMISQIYQKEGWSGFTAGFLPRLLRKPVINASTFFFYEILSSSNKL